jgi:hypothetical protein
VFLAASRVAAVRYLPNIALRRNQLLRLLRSEIMIHRSVRIRELRSLPAGKDSMDLTATTYSMTLEVYLQSAVLRGVLVTNQDRLSNYLILREGDEVLSITDATLDDLQGKTMAAGSAEYLIYMQEVFLIGDLSPQLSSDRAGYEHLYVKKESNKALISVGPYWLKGDIHVIPGAPLHELLLGKTRFFPITDASIIGRPDVASRTYLVNRTKIGCMTALSDGLVEL